MEVVLHIANRAAAGWALIRTDMATTTFTEQLTNFLMKLRFEDIPDPTRSRCIDLILDHLAVSIAGTDLPWTKALKRYAAAQRTTGSAVIYGAGRTSADIAALVNGTMAHGIELDDTHERSVSHPGAVVISTALALAQELDVDDQALITAIVAGYEAMGRIGAAFDPEYMARGSHPTANHGVFGASAVAGKLLGLSSLQLNMAWGIASSMNSGSMAFTEDPLGTMVKRLHAGWPAHSGIVASKLAMLGFTGPRNTLDTKKGYLGRNSPNANRASIVEGLGVQWVIDEISIKPYACCRLFHSSIDAIEQLKAEHSLKPDDVEHVVVRSCRPAIDGHMEYRPESVMSAQYSLPFSIAVALCGSAGDPAQFSEESLKNSSTLNLADRVTAEVSDELDALFPQKYAGSVAIQLRDGTKLEATVLDCSGSAANPLDRNAIEKKFNILTAAQLNPSQQAAFLACIRGMPSTRSMHALSTLLIGEDHEG